jgi:hypothetical protein
VGMYWIRPGLKARLNNLGEGTTGSICISPLEPAGQPIVQHRCGVRNLNWSAQLSSAEQVKVNTSTQSLVRSYEFKSRRLEDESVAVIQETLAEYLAENGWASNTPP